MSLFVLTHVVSVTIANCFCTPAACPKLSVYTSPKITCVCAFTGEAFLVQILCWWCRQLLRHKFQQLGAKRSPLAPAVEVTPSGGCYKLRLQGAGYCPYIPHCYLSYQQFWAMQDKCGSDSHSWHLYKVRSGCFVLLVQGFAVKGAF